MITEFTPFVSLIGGILIGLASVLLMANFGRIMGATGILAGFIMPSSMKDWTWRAGLLAGMFSAPTLYWLVSGSGVPIDVPVSTLAMIVSGVVVGIGVTFGGGCTSGHGVCGMARVSPRSIVATLTFMLFAFITVYLVRHVFGGAI